MAVLEIQSNGDTRVSEEAIARARHSVDDPNMRVSAAAERWGQGGSAVPPGRECAHEHLPLAGVWSGSASLASCLLQVTPRLGQASRDNDLLGTQGQPELEG